MGRIKEGSRMGRGKEGRIGKARRGKSRMGRMDYGVRKVSLEKNLFYEEFQRQSVISITCLFFNDYCLGKNDVFPK